MANQLIGIISVVVGGFSIGEAVCHFKKGRYFFGGMYVIAGVYFAASMAAVAIRLLP